MNNKTIISLIAIILLICMGFMFRASNTPYHQQDIKPQLKSLITLTPHSLPDLSFSYDHEEVSSKLPYDFIEFVIRKCSHIFEYTVLTLIFLALWSSTRLRKGLVIVISFLCSFVFACTDEYHQSFVPERTGHFIDVYTFDSAGMILAILIYLLFGFVIKRRSGRKYEAK
ncbi:VanZ family protein [Peribacillus sp. B-H-3]|uniref:VanZ family protein n=1 Tax=Peribacillus sp. B-H-3 TaxID=3400420 RepID=UPI003B014CE5